MWVSLLFSRIAAKLNRLDSSGGIPSPFLTIRFGIPEVLQKFMDCSDAKQLDPFRDGDSQDNVFHVAAALNRLDMIPVLLNASSKETLLTSPNFNSLLPCHLACQEGHLAVLQALLSAMDSSRSSITPSLLHLACRHGRLPIVPGERTENECQRY